MKCKMCEKINPFKMGIDKVPNPKCLKPKVEENETEQIEIEKPMLSLLDYWKMSGDENGYRKVDEQSLDAFLCKEVDPFIDGMVKDLRSKCNAVGIPNIDP